MCQILTNHQGAVWWQWWGLSLSPPQNRQPHSCELWVGIHRAWPCGWYYRNSTQFMTSTSGRKNKIILTEGGVLTSNPQNKTSPVLFHAHRALIYYCLGSLHAGVLVVLLQTCRKQFCLRSQESFLHSVPKGWAETGKKLVRTSAVSSLNTQQKRLKHEGDGTVGGFESHGRRMNLLTYVGTSCLFLSLCLWLLSCSIKRLVIGRFHVSWKIRRREKNKLFFHLVVPSQCTLGSGFNTV